MKFVSLCSSCEFFKLYQNINEKKNDGNISQFALAAGLSICDYVCHPIPFYSHIGEYFMTFREIPNLAFFTDFPPLLQVIKQFFRQYTGISWISMTKNEGTRKWEK